MKKEADADATPTTIAITEGLVEEQEGDERPPAEPAENTQQSPHWVKLWKRISAAPRRTGAIAAAL